MNFFGVDPLNFTNEDDFWAEVSEAMSASFGPEYSEMGYDDLSHEYDDEEPPVYDDDNDAQAIDYSDLDDIDYSDADEIPF